MSAAQFVRLMGGQVVKAASPKRLAELEVNEVSGVDHPANGAEGFLVIKAAGDRPVKVDPAELRQVWADVLKAEGGSSVDAWAVAKQQTELKARIAAALRRRADELELADSITNDVYSRLADQAVAAEADGTNFDPSAFDQKLYRAARTPVGRSRPKSGFATTPEVRGFQSIAKASLEKARDDTRRLTEELHRRDQEQRTIAAAGALIDQGWDMKAAIRKANAAQTRTDVTDVVKSLYDGFREAGHPDGEARRMAYGLFVRFRKCQATIEEADVADVEAEGEPVAEDDEAKALGVELKAAATEAGYRSAAALADAMSDDGVPTTARTVQAWFAGQRVPDRHRAFKLAELLGYDLEAVKSWWSLRLRRGED